MIQNALFYVLPTFLHFAYMWDHEKMNNLGTNDFFAESKMKFLTWRTSISNNPFVSRSDHDTREIIHPHRYTEITHRDTEIIHRDTNTDDRSIKYHDAEETTINQVRYPINGHFKRLNRLNLNVTVVICGF